ncbi:MAG: hypothetical protein V1790_12315 [Planctomycetota bacterium]
MLPETRRYDRTWARLLVLTWGVQAIMTQSLLLRESLVLMFGSEFAWGIVLFAWLFGVAVGAVVGGWLAERSASTDLWLVAALTALSAAACAELWVFRGARAWLGVAAGELLPLPKAALAGVLFVSPASALVGMAFPLACCLRRTPPEPTPENARLLSLGQVFSIESVGSLLGGAMFSFWAVDHVAPFQIALGCAALTTAAAAAFLGATRRRLRSSVCVAAFCAVALLLSVFTGETIHRRLVDRRWRNLAPGFELCAEAETKYQNLAIARREEQFALYSDGQVAATFPDPYTFVPLAHFWLCQHPSPRNVLVLGGGAEGLLGEILRHPVQRVDYVEADPRLIEFIAPFLSDEDRQALQDPRVTVHHEDARHFIKTQSRHFDLVIARLPEPMSALRARLYTTEFFRELRRAMTPHAVLCLTAAATPGALSEASAEYLASMRATLRTQFPSVTIGWGDPAQVLAATGPGLVTTDAYELSKRYASRGVHSDRFDPAWFAGATDWLDLDKLQERAAELDATTRLSISTDLHPVIYIQRLALWEKMTGGRSRSVLEGLRSVGWLPLILAVLGMGGIALLPSYARARTALGPTQRSSASAGAPAHVDRSWLSQGAVVLSVGSTGFATMALSMIWLFAFQNLYGYVYQRIGWIVALFMAGLALGCGLVGWRRDQAADGERRLRLLWRRLILVDTLLALSALSVPVVLPPLGALQSGAWTFRLVEVCLSAQVLLGGVLGGASFALAGEAQLAMTARAGAAAGSIVSADHAGACLGALSCGILLVPVFGTAATALLIAGIKISSAALLFAAPRLSRGA